MTSQQNKPLGWIEICLTLLLAVGLTAVFWPTLWLGGGLVGGDIYAYFFPQKQYLSEALRAGEIPLWNNRTGHGYPIVGESQTGLFYPFHLIYAALDLNTAYNFVQLTHYAVALLSCWLYLRRWGISTVAAWMGAVSYTYGWLPARMCNEWASLGAAWFPAALWAGESYLQTSRWRYLIGMSFLLGLQMLAGHFHLAFITQVTLVGYLALRIVWFPDQISPQLLVSRRRTVAVLFSFILCGFGIAAIQLLPTWELKQLSQRVELGPEHDPGFGYIPLWYYQQIVMPWASYTPETVLGGDVAGPRTNTVEAHLYFGLLPLALVVVGCFTRGRAEGSRRWVWGIIGGFALIYTSGYLMPVARLLPGFGFFNGVGRFGLVVNLAGAVLAGSTLHGLIKSRRWTRQTVVGLICVLVTIIDTKAVSGLIQHTFVVEKPPIRYLEQSPIRKLLQEYNRPVRLFCRGANLPNLLGVASTPVYLGLGPNAYFDPALSMPQPLPFDTAPDAAQVDWLRNAGVTHILSFNELNLSEWPVQHVLSVADPFLNRAWARGAAPLHLYELTGTRGRVAWQDAELARQNGDDAEVVESRPNRVIIDAKSETGGTLILTELNFPGWHVRIDDVPAVPTELSGPDRQYRAVEVPAGQHVITWDYRPDSVWWGFLISLTTFLLLAGVGHVCFWHPALIERWVGR